MYVFCCPNVSCTQMYTFLYGRNIYEVRMAKLSVLAKKYQTLLESFSDLFRRLSDGFLVSWHLTGPVEQVEKTEVS